MIADDFVLLLNWVLLILGVVLCGLLIWLVIFKSKNKNIKLPVVLITVTAVIMALTSTGYLTATKYNGVWLWKSQKQTLDDVVDNSNQVLDAYHTQTDVAETLGYAGGKALHKNVSKDLKYNQDAIDAADSLKDHTDLMDPNSEYIGVDTDAYADDLLSIATIINEYSKSFTNSPDNDALSGPVSEKAVKQLHLSH